jgi:hypothetical protein
VVGARPRPPVPDGHPPRDPARSGVSNVPPLNAERGASQAASEQFRPEILAHLVPLAISFDTENRGVRPIMLVWTFDSPVRN